MYDQRFFKTKLGRAALASVFAMSVFAALSSHITVTAPSASLATLQITEIA
ncbi:hypothetical protein [Erythrobacter litoralis]|uniref:hypothetical protein n=1 Tax=Erythrobacter litoralis TaxID=39960 RepID=UPI00243607C9|nr:hypothetical protein [Erythrobacter litoralis]